MATIGLFAGMLVIMLMRVALPIGARSEGEPLGRVTLSLAERVRLQRTNVYAIGAVLLLSALVGEIWLLPELVVVLGAVSILAIPVRYTVTSRGIGLNRVVFRPWSDFSHAEVGASGIRLVGKPGLRPFRLVLGPATSQSVLAMIGRFLPERAPDPSRRRLGVLQRG
jgi:hypothetical protein